MWESTVDGRVLNFRLAGINNQNFIMRDEETGSWWQQVSGECIQGPLKGKKLVQAFHDELSFDLWKKEKPNGRVLKPDAAILAQGKYEANWEEEVSKMPVTIGREVDKALEPRALIAGVKIGDQSKAYPVSALEKQSPILDTLGGKDIVIVLGEDKKSIRVFEREVDGKTLEVFQKKDAKGFELADAETGSAWDFTGTATGGELTGRQLKKVPVLLDYWFDWKIYNPNTKVYLLGER